MNIETLLTHFTEKSFRKGDFLIREGQTCHYVFFLRKGLVKLCSSNGDREFIMRFFSESSFVTVFDSFTENFPSHFQIKALEHCEVLMLHRDKMEELCASNHAAETFFRKLVQWTASKMVSRLTEMLENDATARYRLFLKDNSNLLQRIQLGDLASYLGITQASLSKIRAKK